VANDFTTRLLVRIRTLREAKGLSQEAFAELADLKYKHYQAIEAGRKPKFQIPTLVKIAEAFGLKPWQLLNFDIEPDALSGATAGSKSPTAPTKAARKTQKSKVGKKTTGKN
jgi:transcriptional regulator with XRE-family HTH domain